MCAQKTFKKYTFQFETAERPIAWKRGGEGGGRMQEFGMMPRGAPEALETTICTTVYASVCVCVCVFVCEAHTLVVIVVGFQ